MTALPPGPRSSIATLLRYFRDPLHCLLPLVKRYGDPFVFPGQPPLVCVGEPEAIKAVYAADPDSFAPANMDFAALLGDRGLLFLSGAQHRRARRLMAPPFHGARVRAYGDAMRRLTAARSADWQVGQRVSIIAAAQQISLDVILQTVFGVADPAAMAELSALLLETTNGISPLLAIFPALRRSFGGVGPYAAFLRRRDRLWHRLDALIDQARAAPPRDDVLSLLLAARDEDGQPLSQQDLRDQLVLLVFAGHETTAIAIAWAVYALHRPDGAAALARLRTELLELPQGARAEHIACLPYLEAVCNETLRRYPLAPAPNPRKLLRPLRIPGYELPAGTTVSVAIGALHFREDLYPEPLRFLPERFLTFQPTPFQFAPYGGGARRCLGAALASLELKLVLATLLQRFRLRLADPRPDPGAVRAANAGPKRGVAVIIEERLAPTPLQLPSTP